MKPCKWPPMYVTGMCSIGHASCEIVLYVCKRGRRENPKYVIMTFRQKARVRENPKKRDRTIDMYRREGPKYVPGPYRYVPLLGIIPFLMV